MSKILSLRSTLVVAFAAVIVLVAVVALDPAGWRGGAAVAQQRDAAPPPAATEQTKPRERAVATPDAADAPKLREDDHVLGKADAPITIIEYASLTCPHCASFDRETLPQIKQEWIDTGKAKLVFRNFPFDQAALRGAMIAECAGTARFFTFIDAMFRQQDVWARAPDPIVALSRLAKLGGMSEDQVQACIKDEKLANRIVEIRLNAEKDLGVSSTPTFFINNKKLVGAEPYAKFDELLKSVETRS
jgi:protein-disulfide isomerase